MGDVPDLVTVQIDELPSRRVLTRLNLKDELQKTREMLEQNTKVKMDDTLSFAKKISQADNALAEIAKKDEKVMKLEEIIEYVIEDKILYLKPEFNKKKFLNHKYRLDYGCIVTDLGALGKAYKRAFIMEDYEMTEINGFQHDKIEIESNDGWIVKTNSFLTMRTHIQDFAKLGVLIENIKKSNAATNYTYNISECGKVSLKFKEFKPTEVFINEVKAIIKSKDARKFKDVTKEFGQFIPKEVILGGRALFKKHSEYSGGVNGNINGGSIIRVGMNIFTWFRNNSRDAGFKLVGGEQFSSNNFNEQAWVESLNELRNWDCIKFKDPISIFQPLPEALRKQILTLIGKKILYTKTEDYLYNLTKPRMYHTFELKNILPENILEILRNEYADECSIFATVVAIKKAKSDIFNCQILWPSNEDPRLIIHCIQKKFKKKEYKLKIRVMIIGYDINFNFNRPNFNSQLNVQKHEFKALHCQTDSKLNLNSDSSVLCFGIPVLRKLDSSNDSLVIGHHFFKDEENKIGLYTFSYSLKKNHYANLPDFTFYTLFISNYSNSNNCGIFPFKHHFRREFRLDFTKSIPLPKYISLYSTGKDNCDPIFLKQRMNEIKIGYITTSCDQDNCICKNNTLKKSDKKLRRKAEKNLGYAFFDPTESWS